MTKHTPGPWLARQYFSGHWEICENATAKRLATVDKSNPLDVRLIAAAPELLEALQTLRNDFEAIIDGDDMSGMSDSEMFQAFLDTASAAIDKAEGRE